MNKKKVIGICAVVLVGILAFALWPKTPRGEYKAELGMVYFFSDGLVAIDVSRTPNECWIYINDPAAFKKVDIRDDGLWVWGVGVTEEAEEFFGGDISMGHSRPSEGKVKVIENKGEWINRKEVEIELKTIRAFVAKKDWDASVRQLLKN